MTTSQVATVYGTPITPTRIFTTPETRRQDVQLRAHIWFNKRKFRQQARLIMDFVSLPREVSMKYRSHSA